MMFIKNFSKKSAFNLWLWSFIIIIVSTILISGAIYSESNRVLNAEINNANENMLKLLKLMFDSNLFNTDKLGMEIGFNSQVQGIIDADRINNNFYKEDIIATVKTLKNYNVVNPFIKKMYIYVKNNDVVITSSGSTSKETFYDINFKGSSISFDDWTAKMNSVWRGEYTLIETKESDNTYANGLTYFISLPVNEKNNPLATIAIVIDTSLIKEAVSNAKWNKGASILVLNKENNVLYSAGEPEKYTSSIAFSELSEGIYTRKVNNEKLAIACTHSENTLLKYIFIFDSKTFWTKSEYVKKITLIGILILIIFIGGTAYFLISGNYKSVKRLMSDISKKTGVSVQSEKNEFDLISEMVTTAVNEKDRVIKRLDKEKDSQRSLFILKLLTGKISESIHLSESLKHFEIMFYSNFFAVALITIDDNHDIFFGGDTISEAEKLLHSNIIIRNILEEMIGYDDKGFVTEINDFGNTSHLACLINISESNVNIVKFNAVFMEAETFIKENFNIKISISISNIHKSISQIPLAYKEALTALEYRFVNTNDKKLLFYYEVENNPTKLAYHYPIELEQRLINYIKLGDFENLKIVFNEVFEKNMSETSVNSLRCLIFDLIGTVLKSTGDFVQAGYSDILMNIDRNKTLDEVKENILKCFKDICSQIAVKRQNKRPNESLIANCVDYINESYARDDLGVATISDMYGISTDYLSALFKNYIGEPMPDYICKIRIKHAKTLLCDDSLTVSQVAESVGLVNVNTFIRQFKKIEGITPGKYKETINI